MGSYPPVPPDGGYQHAPSGDDPRYAPVPEIIPPEQAQDFGGQGYVPQRRRRRWAFAPATYALVGMNCAVFALMFFAGANPFNPDSGTLFLWGADHAGAVLYDGQWWRIVTAMFIHGGFLHLALNMWCLWNLGMLAEPLMGSVGLAACYLLTGAGGNLLSVCSSLIWPIREPGGGIAYPVGVGASGAVFGIAGALIVLLKSTRLPIPPDELKKLRKSVIYFAAINLVIGFSINAGTRALGAGLGVDNWAHVGGFVSGLLLAAPMVPRIGTPRPSFNRRLRAAVGLLVGVLVLFGFFLTHMAR